MLLINNITDLIEIRKSRGLHTTLHKIKAHANIRGNDLADATAKLAVAYYDTLSATKNVMGVYKEKIPSPGTLGHIHREVAGAPPPGSIHRHHPRHPPPTMVDNTVGGPPLDARLHAAVTAIPTESAVERTTPQT
jgi:hypothetical protein